MHLINVLMNKQKFSEEIGTNGQYVFVKVFVIFTHQENTNSKDFGIPSHCSQNSYHQENDNKCWRGWVERTAVTVGGSVDRLSYCGRHDRHVLETKSRTTM